MRADVQLDTRKFNAFVRELERMATNPAATFEDVLKGEVGKTLELCVKYTGSAKANAYPRKGKVMDQSGSDKIWVTDKDTVWYSERGDGKNGYTHYIMKGPGRWPAKDGEKSSRFSASGARWSDARWNRAQLLLAEWNKRAGTNVKLRKKKKLTGRGLAKRSWVQIADDFNIPMKVPQYVRKAVPQDGKQRKSGTGRKFKTTRSIFFEISNRYPLLLGKLSKNSEFDGTKILQRALNTRVKAFEGDVRRKVFENLKLRAQRYPGVFVST